MNFKIVWPGHLVKDAVKKATQKNLQEQIMDAQDKAASMMGVCSVIYQAMDSKHPDR